MTATSFFLAVGLCAVVAVRTLWAVARWLPRQLFATAGARHRLDLRLELGLLLLAMICLLPSLFYFGVIARG